MAAEAGKRERHVVDWTALLQDLARRGMSPTTIALETELGRSTLVEYREGMKRPTHANGETLIAYWCRVTGNDRSKLPLTHELPATPRVR